METEKTVSTTTTTTTTRRPAWWTAANEASWEKSKASIIEDWKKVTDDAKHLGDQIADKALAFGHEARAKFVELGAWNEDVQKQLAEDWKKTEGDASEGWSHVSKAVKLGWERAKATVKH